MHVPAIHNNACLRDVLVIHETNGRKYLEALTVLRDRGEISSLKFVEASVAWKLAHSLIRERKMLLQALRQSLRNLAFRLNFWRIRNQTVILALPPWDYRFLLYALLRRQNRLIYNTSWPSWHQSRVPRSAGILTPLLRSGWRRLLSGPGIEVVAVTSAAAESVSSVVQLKRSATVIPHAVSEVFFEVRAQYGTPFRLLFVGELSEKKGVLELSPLLDALNSEGVTMDIVGDGSLRRVAIEIARRPGCRWHGQLRSRTQLAEIAAQCQIFISPALRSKRWEELFGMSIVEGMASGLPCIVSDHVGPRSIITSGRDGILVHEHAVDEIAGCVRKLQRNPGEWKSISDHAVATAQEYSLSKVTDRWHHLLVTQPI
jgi:glycosyltransferase involved in cell wall biosynthesis